MQSRRSACACRKLRQATGLIIWPAMLLACSGPDSLLPSWTVEAIDNPSPPGSMAPSLHSGPDAVWISWLAPAADGAPSSGALPTDQSADPHWVVSTARLGTGAFGEADRAATSSDMFANWADFPSIATAPSGTQFTHHLGKLGQGTYAYGVLLHARRGTDAPWTDLGLLHDDASATEHGFVSYTHHEESLRAFWLDGRLMLGGGPMTLRTSPLPEPTASAQAPATPIATGPDEPSSDVPIKLGATSQLLDERVCECCQTDAATTDDGPIVVYRDRSLDEVRDIYIVRFEDGSWTEPTPVHNDGWEIAGCPVNGPSVVAHGNFVAVAWFTAADDEPRTRLAVSEDGGRNFSRPLDLAGGRGGGKALGRIDLAMQGTAPEAAGGRPSFDLWIAHLARPAGRSEAEGPAIVVDHLRFDERLQRGSQTVVAETTEARASGFPRLAIDNGEPVIAWTARADTTVDAPSRVHTARLVRTSYTD